MDRKILIVLILISTLLSGCKSQDNISYNVKPTEDKIVEAEPVPDHFEKSIVSIQRILSYNVNRSFDQGGVITTVRKISIYPDSEYAGYNIIEFDLGVKNTSGKDVYMVYDISPIILSTGEQIDDTEKCSIHRVFKTAFKEGQLKYKVKTNISDIKTIRWVLVSPLHGGSEIIGSDEDFTFNLEEYERYGM